MKLKDAYALLDTAPVGNSPSAINPNLTKTIAVNIVRNGIALMERPKDSPCGLEDEICEMAEKRVYQVTKNQKRPRY